MQTLEVNLSPILKRHKKSLPLLPHEHGLSLESLPRCLPLMLGLALSPWSAHHVVACSASFVFCAINFSVASNLAQCPFESLVLFRT